MKKLFIILMMVTVSVNAYSQMYKGTGVPIIGKLGVDTIIKEVYEYQITVKYTSKAALERFLIFNLNDPKDNYAVYSELNNDPVNSCDDCDLEEAEFDLDIEIYNKRNRSNFVFTKIRKDTFGLIALTVALSDNYFPKSKFPPYYEIKRWGDGSIWQSILLCEKHKIK